MILDIDGFLSQIVIFPKKKSLEHAEIWSEGFQNPRLHFFQTKTTLSTPSFDRRASRIPDCRVSENKQPWTCPDSIGGLPESQNWLPESLLALFSRKQTALSMPEFDQSTFKNPRCHFSRRTKHRLEHSRILSADSQIPYFSFRFKPIDTSLINSRNPGPSY